MKKFLEITLGILTAIGGFVDIGDIVANAESGARFHMSLAWVVIVGVVGIIVYAEMSGRVAALSGRAVFDLVRERLGPRVALTNLLASYFINFLTLTAEIAGVSLALQLASSVNYLLWIPLVAFLVWFVIWRVKFETMERIFGILGLVLIVFVVVVWRLGDWHTLSATALHPSIPKGEGIPTYFFFAIALFGAAMTPYEVFFFSSGAVEEHWTRTDLMVNRANVYIGFALGGILSLALMASADLVLSPGGISVSHLSQVTLPAALTIGKLGVAVTIVGFFAATFGAALETALSAGYTVSQFFGWQWGTFVKRVEAPRFHAVVILSVIMAAMVGLTTIDPIKVTEYSIVLSAAALPLTYFPILVIANDPDYVGEKTNSKFLNVIAFSYLVLLVIVALATIPLMIATKGGS
ncbi:MAG: NRAMP family divalent metal transporter [Actinomycetota bacterium]|nr:divalent metal cation transporter [Actinomycetota bacterium]